MIMTGHSYYTVGILLAVNIQALICTAIGIVKVRGSVSFPLILPNNSSKPTRVIYGLAKR
jgi:hypothetical protein